LPPWKELDAKTRSAAVTGRQASETARQLLLATEENATLKETNSAQARRIQELLVDVDAARKRAAEAEAKQKIGT